ncbi:MAG: hypothetical protein JXR53_03530 [Bacteroidales bacterium]|nr:hypothetical protein [Bacteroidales bacterium]
MKSFVSVILVCFSFLVCAQTDTLQKKEFVAELFYQMNSSRVDGFSLDRNACYIFETGAKINLNKHKIINNEGNLFFSIAFKKSNDYWPVWDEVFTSKYLNFGMGYSIYFRLSRSFSLSLSDELMLNIQVQAEESNPGNGYYIDYTDRALQNKLGLMFFWDFSKFCSIGFGPKIAPCLRLSPRKYGSVSHTEYYVSVLDEGWPFYIGSTIRIKL